MSNFWSMFGTDILLTIIGIIFCILGFVAKKLVNRFLNTKEKRQLAEDVVLYVEQKFKDKHGKDKLNEALNVFAQILLDRGITSSITEMETLLEAALGSFNDAFNTTK